METTKSDLYQKLSKKTAEKRAQRENSLKRLRRDRGKVEEFITQLMLALEKRGGEVEHLFGTLSERSNAPSIEFIADYVMGVRGMLPFVPIDIVTQFGKSDEVMAAAIQYIKEEELPTYLLIRDPGFTYPLTRLAITEKLTDQERLKKVALYGGRDDGELAVSKLTSPSDLVQVALSSDYPSTAFAALDRLSQNHLVHVVNQHAYLRQQLRSDVAESAVNKLSDEKMLRGLLEETKGFDYIRRIVYNRLELLKTERQKITPK